MNVRREGSLPATWRRPLSVYAAGEESGRHATWLELFFDLVFVVAIAELGRHLHDNLTPLGILQFASLFVIVWWVWLAYSYYADMYDATDFVSRLTMVGAMFVVIFLSQSVDGVFIGDSFAFALAVFVLRAVLTGLHLRGRHVDPEAQEFLTYWTGSEVLTTLVWATSLFVPEPGRFGLWAAAFAINMAGVFVLYTVFDSVLVQISHFPERLGLFTIIVLGEALLAVAFGTDIATATRVVYMGPLLAGCAGFAIAVAAWWLYFNRFDESIIDRALQVRDETWLEARQRGLAYVFSHYFVHVGIVAAGIGIEVAMEAEHAHHAISFPGLVVLCGGIAAFLLGTGICHRMIDSRIDNQVFGARMAAVVAISLLVFVGPGVSPIAIVVLIALVLAALIVFEGVLHAEAEPIGVEIGPSAPREPRHG